MNQQIIIAIALRIALALGGAYAGEASGKKIERKGPLADIPSAPGPTVEKIKALGDNQWLNLGKPAPDPKWGGAQGRSWCGPMPYAPDLQGAFIGGQGAHGGILPNGRYDDWYFYDINGHRWICLFPGIDINTFVSDIKTGKIRMNDDGQLVDKDGDPLLSVGHHIYQTQTYDTDLKKYICFFGFGNSSGMPVDQHTVSQPWSQEGNGLLREQMKGKQDKVQGMPCLFDTVSGKWERPPAVDQKPGSGVDACYLPGKKAIFFYRHDPGNGPGTVHLYDSTTRKVTDLHATGAAPPAFDFGMCYDSKRDRIYFGGGSYRRPYGPNEGFIYFYDVKANSWTNVPNKGSPAIHYGANDAVMNYDSVNDKVIVIEHKGDRQGVYVFDPQTLTWTDAALPLPKEAYTSEGAYWQGAKSGFYSPEFNAHFLYFSADSRTDAPMFVYRYKKEAQ